MSTLLKRFIDSFQKAITAEMDAMRRRLGPFEVPLGQGKLLETGEGERSRFYVFKMQKPNDKVVVQAECTLRYKKGELLVTITDIQQDEVTLRSDRNISLGEGDCTLVIYPWFLYERLKVSLDTLLEADDFFVSNALTLFGQGEPRHQPQPLQVEHAGLNTSQQQAVQLCCDSNLAFVWGPPGTGKTTTLGHIVTELLGQGQRILITSTTNAAVDQALACLADMAEAQAVFEQGQIVRIGQTQADTFGASLKQVVKRLNVKTEACLEHLRQRHRDIGRLIKRCQVILEKLEADIQPLQLNLFDEVKAETISARDLQSVFSDKRSRVILSLPPAQQQTQVARRQQRLETALALYRQKMSHCSQELRRQEAVVVQKARVVLATMTNVYLSNLLKSERFDAVIVEEAGMAILPTLFYCAALARTKVIMVGDPKQLPPIVQSRDEYVYRAMGRNIFVVAARNAAIDEFVVMLDIQYRMHPVIGELVSTLFYDGKLRHSEHTSQRDEIAKKQPYPGDPLIVIDTAGQTECAKFEDSFSRLNEKTAQLCVDLAVAAVQDGIDSVAIITPYVAQSRLIRQRLSRLPQVASQVECRTVHRFQGGERDVVILDTVDTAPLRPGVLLADLSAQNLINVSLSRARGKLIIISDVSYFKHNASRGIINEMVWQAMQTGRQVSWAGIGGHV